ncbi:hypothetical protein M9458_026220, partial [Cirrhinus mrigala]
SAVALRPTGTTMVFSSAGFTVAVCYTDTIMAFWSTYSTMVTRSVMVSSSAGTTMPPP